MATPKQSFAQFLATKVGDLASVVGDSVIGEVTGHRDNLVLDAFAAARSRIKGLGNPLIAVTENGPKFETLK